LETQDKPLLADIAKSEAMREGVGTLRLVFTPVNATSTDISKFVDALTKPLTAEEEKSGSSTSDKHEGVLMTGTYKEVQEAFMGELRYGPFGGGPWAEMTDGLPVAPPTEEAVVEMLKGTSHDPDEIVNFWGFMAPPPGGPGAGPPGGPGAPGGPGEGPPGGPGTIPKRIATVRKVAINAVMAGCRPEDMPAILAIAESGACVGYPGDSSFGHFYVVSGPYAKEIGMNAGFDFLNPGNPANTRLQRACTLMGINLGGCLQGLNCLERTGTLHWGTIFAENTDSPWEGLNENLGYKSDESVLLAWGQKVQLVPFQQIEVMPASGPRGDPKSPVIASLKTLTNDTGALLVFTPDTAHVWAKEFGFKNMKQLQDYVWDNVTRRKSDWMSNYWFRVHQKAEIDRNPRDSRMLNPDYYDLPDDAQVPMFISPDAITIIVAGGSGNAWAWGGTFGKPRAISIDKWR